MISLPELLYSVQLIYAANFKTIPLLVADFGGIRTPVSVDSVHLFRRFRTPGEGAVAATGVT